jgi:hypothetical protein
MDKIKLGFAPTRRSIFSAPDAIKYRGLTKNRLMEAETRNAKLKGWEKAVRAAIG